MHLAHTTTRRIGVLMGGWGEERDISIKSGEAIVQALEAGGHDVVRVLAGPGLDQTLRNARIDVAVLALHGRMGEDGKVQGLLEVMGIPYTGSGTLAAALAMHKGMTKKVLRQHNLATPTGYLVATAELDALDARHGDLGFPCVVKPARGGSSVGLSVVTTRDGLRAAVAEACRYGGEAMVERYVKGREVTVAVLNGRVLGTCEIAHGRAAFDAAAKYEGGVKYHLPARLSETRLANVESMALAAVQALGCRGAVRVDFICSDTLNDVVLELNTTPGMTPTSLFPKIAAKAGIPFPMLCEAIVAGAQLESAPLVDVAPSAEALQRAAS
ncbi:MAG: D-alanine--D-alanine ligase [Archangium sp.]|nr:D-alanine--D-alanine ligase [Archangium sp.]